jgi:hypothetical protein
MKPQNNDRMTQDQLWIVAWFCLISAAFLFGMAFALGDFPTYIYRTANAFGFAALTCGIGCLSGFVGRSFDNEQ